MVAGLGLAVFRLPLFLAPLGEAALLMDLTTEVAATLLLILLLEELGLPSRPLTRLAAFIGGLDLFLEPLPEFGVSIFLLL